MECFFSFWQRRRFFHIRNKERGHFLSIQGGVEELKSGRVVVTEAVEGMSEVWFYQDGLIKNKVRKDPEKPNSDLEYIPTVCE